ncbi:MAG: ATP-binding protein [Planctomycetes bacterium]|nr:ATP-binding protein [Planctomycetota bacterium]
MYTPFSKRFDELIAPDLEVLRSVPEGWYVEYKREVPAPTSIAKSISAFANTFGGWLFYGVEEVAKENPVAGTLRGIPKDQIDAAIQRIRQSVAENSNPTPFFEARPIWGPLPSMRLEAEHAIICVRTPSSLNAPHVHKNGVIYRRVADSSEPKPESDRFVLDQLFRRADGLRTEYATWIDDDPEFSKAEGNTVYARLLLVADLWKDQEPWLGAPLQEVRGILGGRDRLLSSVPLDTVHSTSYGYVGRQLAGNNPELLGLTWKLKRTLESEVIVPLPLYTPGHLSVFKHKLRGYANIDRFASLLERHAMEAPRIVDLNHLFGVILGIVRTQRLLLRAARLPGKFYAKVKLLHVWRTIPFIDVVPVLEGFERSGLPMCLESSVLSPPGAQPESFFELNEHDDVGEEAVRMIVQSMMIFGHVALAYGVPSWMDHAGEGELPPYHEELVQAGERAMNVQRDRVQEAREKD